MKISKPALTSKTIWVQIVTVIAALFPAIQTWLAENPVAVVSIFAAVNTLVRFVTSGKVHVFGNKDDGDMTGAVSLVCVCMMGLAALSVASLTSCSGVKGEVLWRDGKTGAKAGLELEPGVKPKVVVRVPRIVVEAGGK